MDSEESRPGSSTSNSSTNSSGNTHPSSPTHINDNDGPKSPPNNFAASPQSSLGTRSRPQSQSSNENIASPGSISKSDSESSSSSSSSDNEEYNENDNVGSNNHNVLSLDKNDCSALQNQLASQVNSCQSSRASCCSSNRSRSTSHERLENRAVIVGLNISHEDLSDVSDMESEKRNSSSFNNSKQSLVDESTNLSATATALEDGDHIFSQDPTNSQDAGITDLRQKLDQKKNQFNTLDNTNNKTVNVEGIASNGSGEVGESLEDDLVKTHDEDALDFEAEEGECQDISKESEKQFHDSNVKSDKEKTIGEKSDGEAEDGEELEEGEVSDEDEKRPEETEPKPVCRFYTRGQCTWGMSCRFLHPGVTDKGNYTMFDLVRPVPLTQSNSGPRSASFAGHNGDYHDYRNDRPVLHQRSALHHAVPGYSAHHDPRPILPETPVVVVESAWERGLRTAKEMMRKANKRKEQDMDFEDKKMNLTLSPDELEKDQYYLKERTSPPDAVPPYGRHGVYQEISAGIYNSPERFSRAPGIPPYDEVDPYGRSTRYRELPPHRMPQYEDERRVRPTREVIVQRVEPVGRGDEWNDPWMRSKSPGGRGGSRDRGDKRRRDHRSYSSNSSYSSSSTSQSDSSSESSRSPSPADHRRRYNSNFHKSPLPTRRHGTRVARSPSPPIRRSRHSPTKRRQTRMSSSPTLVKRGAFSPPIHKRKKMSSVSKNSSNDKSKLKHRHISSSSGSGSSDSSATDSDSDSASSSSESSSHSRDRTPPKRSRGGAQEKNLNERKSTKKVEPPKKRSPISIEIKKQATVGASALISPTNSVSSEKDSKKSRREELLKQLRAVEDAIAKKRSKLA